MISTVAHTLASLKAYQWVKTYPITLLSSCILVGYLISYWCTPASPWADLYLRASHQMIHGENIYRHDLAFTYPPCRAMVMMPFLALPPWGQQLAWWACNAACLMLMCRWMWKIAGGTRLEPVSTWSTEHFIWLAGLLTGVFYVFNGLSNQATDVLETTVMLAGCMALIAGRPLQAATWLGIAAGFKATPLLWCVYLLWRREWAATVWLVAVAIGINLLPDLISQCPTAPTWLGGWIQQNLAQFQNTSYAPGSWGTHVYYNQSLAGMLNRMVFSDWTWSDGAMKVVSLTPALSPQFYKMMLLAFEAALLIACILLCWKRPAVPEMHESRRFTMEQGLEQSMVLMLMVLFSPVSSKSHFCGLILPGMLLARIAWEQRSRWLGGIFLVANVIGFISLTWWGEYVARVSLYYGTVTIKTLLLLLGCGLALNMLRGCATSGIESVAPSNEPGWMPVLAVSK